MLYDGRQNRMQHNFMDLVDREFVETTRFTKERVEYMTERLDPYLSTQTQRGHPLTPLSQVIHEVKLTNLSLGPSKSQVKQKLGLRFSI